MSYCEVWAVKQNGDCELYDEARNSWGGGMHIWTTLAEKYGVPGSTFQGLQKLWKMYGGSTMNRNDQWVLGSTFDKVVCKKEELPQLIAALKNFIEGYPTDTLIKEISILETALNDPEVIGVAWCQTSVCSFNEIIGAEFDRQTEEYKPYNIFRQNNHWFLGEGLEG